MKKKLIVANWKMNPPTLKQAEAIIRRYRDVSNLVVCPPSIFLGKIKLNNAKLGAQNCSWVDSGSLTGEISPKMIKSFGCKYVILGHFERRSIFGEDSKTINLKLKAALKNNLNVILCVGEDKLDDSYLIKQIKDSIKDVGRDLSKVIIAYEPFWAIGSGKACSPIIAENRRVVIKGVVNSKVLYGGSVNQDNYLDYSNFDGLLVGGLSLKPEFNSII
ncbi:MAG: triose-phosphate isomerase [Candidatus Pacebacteria bacterium]|nr:triose-phosphate isomerase [Candidatus Paceibacterota bacterium]